MRPFWCAEMFVAVCYDISSDRRRRKVVKVLEGYGTRVQKSVFECSIGEKQFVELKSRLSELIAREGDLLRYYRLCRSCLHNVEFTGGRAPVEPREHLVV